MRRPASWDIVIVGGGIAGVSAAFELAGQVRVLVLEKEPQPGYHATGRSAAMFTETYGNRTVRGLTRASRGFLASPPAGFAEHPLLTPRGAMHIGGVEQLEALDRRHWECGALNGATFRCDASFACDRVPVLRRDRVTGCVWEPDAMDIDVHSLHHGYLKALRTRGGEVWPDTELVTLIRRAGSWELGTSRGSLQAAVVVVASGAWADMVGRMAGAAPIGLIPRRRTAVLVALPAIPGASRWPLVIDIDESFYFKPEAGKMLVSPADETPVPPGDAQPEEWDMAVAMDRLVTATTLDPQRIEQRWAGLRTFAPDRTPVVGFDPQIDGLFWLAGQGGYGIQTAPAMARVAAALLHEKDIPPDIADFGVSRAELDPGRLHGPHRIDEVRSAGS